MDFLSCFSLLVTTVRYHCTVQSSLHRSDSLSTLWRHHFPYAAPDTRQRVNYASTSPRSLLALSVLYIVLANPVHQWLNDLGGQ